MQLFGAIFIFSVAKSSIRSGFQGELARNFQGNLPPLQCDEADDHEWGGGTPSFHLDTHSKALLSRLALDLREQSRLCHEVGSIISNFDRSKRRYDPLLWSVLVGLCTHRALVGKFHRSMQCIKKSTHEIVRDIFRKPLVRGFAIHDAEVDHNKSYGLDVAVTLSPHLVFLFSRSNGPSFVPSLGLLREREVVEAVLILLTADSTSDTPSPPPSVSESSVGSLRPVFERNRCQSVREQVKMCSPPNSLPLAWKEIV